MGTVQFYSVGAFVAYRGQCGAPEAAMTTGEFARLQICQFWHTVVEVAAAPEQARDLEWVGDSREELSAFPDEVKRIIGFALRNAQEGKKHPQAKPLQGFGGAAVLEVVEDFDGNAYRAVYTVKFKGVVYVLHAFQKKSKRGGQTPRAESRR